MAEAASERFRIVRYLGRGGWGEVYLAKDSRLHREVAIKKIFDKHVADPDSRRRILHEARAAARLSHANIVTVHDVIEMDGRPCIVMEYVPGAKLAARVAQGAMDSDNVMRIGTQLADALAAAHAAGVLHRDLKPSNIMLTPAGIAKILDFGLARTRNLESVRSTDTTASTETSDREDPNAIVGTLPYMPPEILQGQIADGRSDIYSLGVTLFELLTGRRPFTGDSQAALVAAITSKRTPQAAEADHSIPHELSGVVARAMARDPDERYQTAKSLATDLQRVAQRRPRPARRLAWATAATAVGLLGVWLWRHPEALRPASPMSNVVAVLPFLSLSPDSVTSYVAAGITDIVRTNLAALPVTVAQPGETSKFRTLERDPEAAARELGALLVIDGSVQKYAEQLRVTLKLSRRGSNAIAWTHIVDGDAAGVLRLQEKILAVLPEGLVEAGLLRQPPDPASRERLTRPPTSNEEAYADYNQARAFLEMEGIPDHARRAATLFESAIRKDPGFALAFGGLAEARFALYRRTRDRAWAEQAELAVTTALAMDSTATEVRYSRSSILFGTGALDEAERELDRLIQEKPKHDAAHSLLGDVYEKQGRIHEAIREFHAAIRLRPEYWRYRWRLATTLQDYGHLEEAASEARRAAELQPDNPRVFQLWGTILQKQGKNTEAKQMYDKSLALAPTAAAYSNIGGLWFDAGDFAEAARLYQQAITVDARLPVYRRNLGDALLELGRLDEARSAFATAVALADSILLVNPNDATTIALQALCLAKLRRREDALARIDDAARQAPASTNVLYKKTAILALLGDTAPALQALEKALAAGYPPSIAAKDPDLRSLAGTEEFRRLVDRP